MTAIQGPLRWTPNPTNENGRTTPEAPNTKNKTQEKKRDAPQKDPPNTPPPATNKCARRKPGSQAGKVEATNPYPPTTPETQPPQLPTAANKGRDASPIHSKSRN